MRAKLSWACAQVWHVPLLGWDRNKGVKLETLKASFSNLMRLHTCSPANVQYFLKVSTDEALQSRELDGSQLPLGGKQSSYKHWEVWANEEPLVDCLAPSKLHITINWVEYRLNCGFTKKHASWVRRPGQIGLKINSQIQSHLILKRTISYTGSFHN